jgi:hypothetical protein
MDEEKASMDERNRPWMRESAAWMRIAPQFLIHEQATDNAYVFSHPIPMDERFGEGPAA